MRDVEGHFVAGMPPDNRCWIGTVRIRTRHKRRNEKRAWVKTEEPNTWRLRAQVVWERDHGPVPRGFVVHHKDENKLNDAPENLELLTKAAHLAEHVEDYRPVIVAKLVAARRERRWSTKSTAKRTGRPPQYSPESMSAAITAVRGGVPVAAAAKAQGVARTTLKRLVDGQR